MSKPLIARSSPLLLVASCDSLYDAQLYVDVKSFDGWKVLIPPFVTKQSMADLDDERTQPEDIEWTVILHRFY